MQSKNYYEQTVYLPFLVPAIQHSTSTITESRISKGKAILSGTIANYSPDDHPDLKIGAPNIVMGQPKPSSRLSKQTEASKSIFLSIITHKYG